MITPEAVNFMAMHGRGLICIAMTGERLDELELAQMSSENTALGGTAFTVSVDGAVLEALEGFIPVCPRFSAQGARRFEPDHLIASQTSPAAQPTAVAA